VLELAKKKPWLREECGWVIYRSVYDAAAQKADVKFAELALSLAHANDMARSPEGVALWLAVKDAYPDANFPSNCWKQNDPLNTREQAALSKVMRESSKDTDSNQGREQQGTKTPGSWNPKLHFAWDIILTNFYEESAKNGPAKDPRSKSSRMGFREFWIEVIDSKPPLARIRFDVIDSLTSCFFFRWIICYLIL
jgi:DNA polymerase phi